MGLGWRCGAGDARLRRRRKRRKKGAMPGKVMVTAQPGDGLPGHGNTLQGRLVASAGAPKGRKHFPR